MEHTIHQERRDFLRKVSLSAGGLLLGFTLFEDLAAQTGKGHVIDGVHHDFNSYLSRATDGSITTASDSDSGTSWSGG